MKKTPFLPDLSVKVGDIIMLPVEKMDNYLSSHLLLVLKIKPDIDGRMWNMTCWDFSRKQFYYGGNPHYIGWVKVV